MKKKYFLLLVLMLLPMVCKAYTGSSGMTYQDCVAFSDNYVNISNSYEYKICYRAACSSTGTWTLMNMGSSGYKCTNGNAEPYVDISNGCSSYTGSCQLNSGNYCTVVKKVNCNLTKDGKKYSNPSTSTETQTKEPLTVKSSTTKKTTKKTTKSGNEYTISTTTTTTMPTKPVITTETEARNTSNTNVNKITINGQEQNINNNDNEYIVNVPYGVSKLEINVNTEADLASVNIIGADELQEEDGDVIISITAEDGTQRNILFHVKRYYELSKDCSLKYIKINNEEIKKFKSDNYKYTVKVNKEAQSLLVDTEPTDAVHSTYVIEGNKDLKNKSIITISVTAENGDVCKYEIKVKKPSGIWIPIVIIIIVVGILIGIGYYVYGYFKRSKDQYQYE